MHWRMPPVMHGRRGAAVMARPPVIILGEGRVGLVEAGLESGVYGAGGRFDRRRGRFDQVLRQGGTADAGNRETTEKARQKGSSVQDFLRYRWDLARSCRPPASWNGECGHNAAFR
jgi:hypothetical protein